MYCIHNYLFNAGAKDGGPMLLLGETKGYPLLLPSDPGVVAKAVLGEESDL